MHLQSDHGTDLTEELWNEQLMRKRRPGNLQATSQIQEKHECDVCLRDYTSEYNLLRHKQLTHDKSIK